MERDQQVKKLKEMLDDNKVCMMVTQSNDGLLRSRPMSCVEIDDNGDIWFFANEYSEKVDEIAKDKLVHLCFSSPSKNTFIAINAHAELNNDKSKMQALWSPVLKAWFPGGLDDPELLLIKTSPDEVEYWDSPSSKMVVAFKMLKAIATGEIYEGKGDHGKMNL